MTQRRFLKVGSTTRISVSGTSAANNASFAGRTRISKSWLFTPPLHGTWALAVSLIAMALPTVVRLDMSPQMDPRACVIFCPFVLAVAILCGWRYAIATAIGSAIIRNWLTGAPYAFHFAKSDIAAFSTFLGYSAFVIVIVQLFRMTAARSLRQAGAEEQTSGIVFSLDDGQAWASWYGIDAPVRLGPRDEVVEMMEDFIAQVELGKRLQGEGSQSLHISR